MEIFRSMGLEGAIRATASARDLADNSGIIIAETLAGKQLAAFDETYMLQPAADLSEVSPTGWALCDQDELEPLLRKHAESLGAQVRFRTELVSFEQDAGGVTAAVKDGGTGGEHSVRAQYLVAADGAAGTIREKLGIGTSGPGTLASYMGIYFRADLRGALGQRRFVMCYVFNESVMGSLLPVDNAHRWLLHVPFDPASGQREEDFTPQRCTELVRAATGLPGLAVDVRGVSPWEAAGRTADAFRQGRVLLVGDCAHVMPPTGAFGSNTAVQAAHNLAWKLALVLRGQAGEGLLGTYHDERRAIGALTVEQAVLRSKDRPGKPASPEDAAAIVPDLDLTLGYGYDSAAVAGGVADGGAADGGSGKPRGLPGTRAPHVWLRRGGERISTLDLFGRTFTVLTGPGGGAWQQAAHDVASDLGISVSTHRIGGDGLADGGGDWQAAYSVGPSGVSVVRPDGFVCWRRADAAPDPRRELASALRAVLARSGAGLVTG